MAHAGTMDLGQTRKAARGGNPWLVVAVIVAIMAATLGAFWFTSGSGLTTSAALARPAADNTYQIEAQRGLATYAGDRGYDPIEAQRGLATTPALTTDQVEQLRNGDSLVVSTGATPSATSGTFHAGYVVSATAGGAVIDVDRFVDPIDGLTGGSAIVTPHPLDPIEQMGLGAKAVQVAPVAPSLFDYRNQQMVEKLRIAAGNGAGAFDTYIAPAAASAAVVIGPGDYGIEQLNKMQPKRDRVGGP